MPSISADNPGSSVQVNTTSTPVVAKSKSRAELIITNDSDVVIYLHLDESGATAHNGIRLNPEGGYWGSTEYQGPVCAAAISGSGKRLCVVEV